jgi:uncharacterized membrane protein
MEGAGLLCMLAGSLWTALAAMRIARRTSGEAGYQTLRRNLGRAILLGLESSSSPPTSSARSQSCRASGKRSFSR